MGGHLRKHIFRVRAGLNRGSGDGRCGEVLDVHGAGESGLRYRLGGAAGEGLQLFGEIVADREPALHAQFGLMHVDVSELIESLERDATALHRLCAVITRPQKHGCGRIYQRCDSFSLCKLHTLAQAVDGDNVLLKGSGSNFKFLVRRSAARRIW